MLGFFFFLSSLACLFVWVPLATSFTNGKIAMLSVVSLWLNQKQNLLDKAFRFSIPLFLLSSWTFNVVYQGALRTLNLSFFIVVIATLPVIKEWKNSQLCIVGSLSLDWMKKSSPLYFVELHIMDCNLQRNHFAVFLYRDKRVTQWKFTVLSFCSWEFSVRIAVSIFASTSLILEARGCYRYRHYNLCRFSSQYRGLIKPVVFFIFLLFWILSVSFLNEIISVAEGVCMYACPDLALGRSLDL